MLVEELNRMEEKDEQIVEQPNQNDKILKNKIEYFDDKIAKAQKELNNLPDKGSLDELKSQNKAAEERIKEKIKEIEAEITNEDKKIKELIEKGRKK